MSHQIVQFDADFGTASTAAATNSKATTTRNGNDGAEKECSMALTTLEAEIVLSNSLSSDERTKMLGLVRQCRDSFQATVAQANLTHKRSGGGSLRRSHTMATLIPTSPQQQQQNQPLQSPPRKQGSIMAGTSFTRARSWFEQSSAANDTSATTAPVAVPSTFGHCVAASLYFLLESLMVRCEADRLSLYVRLKNGGALQQVMNVGKGMPLVKKANNANLTGIVQAVFSSKIAANLDVAGLEDVADCPGPTVAKNAIFFPVLSACSDNNGVVSQFSSNNASGGGVCTRDAVGVVGLVNFRRGAAAFTTATEQILAHTLPSVAYLIERYPLDYISHCFDPSPIHQLVPLPVFTPPVIDLPPELHAPLQQLVYHRSGPEKYIRKQQLVEQSEPLLEQSAAMNLLAVEEYLGVMEDCWRSSCEERMQLDRLVRHKQLHLVDAREILLRKQRKLDLLKDTLCEQMEKAAIDATVVRQQQQNGNSGINTSNRYSSNRAEEPSPNEHTARGRLSFAK